MKSRRDDIVGIGQGAGAGVAFGTLAVFAKLGQRDGADSIPLLAARFAIATVVLAVYQRVRPSQDRIPRSAAVRLFLLGGLGYAGEATLFFVALEHTSAAAVSLVFYTYPIWVSVLGIATGLERFNVRLGTALVLGFAGVVLIFSFPESGLKGPLLAAGAALAVAVYILLAQVLSRGIEPVAAGSWTVAGAACFLAVPAVGLSQDLPAAALPEAGALGVATTLAFVGFYAALGRIGAARASVAMMVEPVTTVLLAALLLDEDLSLRVAVATALIVAALPVLASTQRPQLDSARTPKTGEE
jgi:drug/metabolite transporter (DMT)-like permease